MSPDDPRHGQNRGYIAGCRSACCRRAHARHHKNQRTRKYLARVDSLQTSGLGTRRRIQALMALGWSTRKLDELVDRQPSYVYRILTSAGDVYLTTANLINDLYDRLSMTKPPATPVTARNAAMARRKGYVPPLAWRNIDDPAETPHGWQYVHAERAEALADFDADQLGVSEVCRRLGVTRGALQKWCANHDQSDLYRRLSNREDGMDADRKRGAA